MVYFHKVIAALYIVALTTANVCSDGTCDSSAHPAAAMDDGVERIMQVELLQTESKHTTKHQIASGLQARQSKEEPKEGHDMMDSALLGKKQQFKKPLPPAVAKRIAQDFGVTPEPTTLAIRYQDDPNYGVPTPQPTLD